MEAKTRDFKFDVDDLIQTELEDRYILLKDLCDAELSDIQDLPRVGKTIATKIKLQANEFFKQSKKVGPSTEDSAAYQGSLFGEGPVPFTRNPTKEEREALERAKELQDSEEAKKLYILREQKVDSKYTKRDRILKTPSVCELCGFDILTANGITEYTYDELSSIDQAKISRALIKHKEVSHSGIAGKRIITGAELQQTNWMSAPSIIR